MFKVGDMIAHPMHGAGIIDGIEEKRVQGVTRSYYVLTIPTGGMVLWIPTDSCEAIGVRPIVSANVVEAVIAAIPEIEIDVSRNWKQRYRENMLRIKSGDLMEVARVIKCLVQRDRSQELSTGERKMLHSAKQILISEIVLAKELPYEEAERSLNDALA